jgi:hypothetical protein
MPTTKTFGKCAEFTVHTNACYGYNMYFRCLGTEIHQTEGVTRGC